MSVRGPSIRLSTAERRALLRAGLAELRRRAPEGAPDLLSWSAAVPEPKAGALDFRLFPFQRELYAEATDDRELVIMKSTQVGVSAFLLRWALYHADVHGRTCVYVFPTSRDMRDFTAARVKRVIDGSPLRERRRAADPSSRDLIAVGGGLVYFRGSESGRSLDSIDADVLAFDEYDTLRPENIPDAERRISGPLATGLIRRVGVPSVPDWGIARLYGESDRRRWLVKCSGCNDWQPVTFHENVDLERGIRVCRKCRKSIESDIAGGQWVPERVDGSRPRGYHVSRLIAPTADIGSIIAASKKKNPFEVEVFWNKDLGEPYVATEGRLSREAIAAAQSRGGGYTMPACYNGGNLVTMGVDVATTRNLTVRVSEHMDEYSKRALWIGEVDRFFDSEPGEGPALETLMERFGVHLAVVDHLPEGRLARAFAERFRGRVFLVAYSNPSERDPNVLTLDEEMRSVTVHRTKTIDATFEMIRQQKNHLPEDLPDGYVPQMGALVRVLEEDDTGRKKVFYRRVGDADDYAHAEAYDVVATEVWWCLQGLHRLAASEPTTLDDHLDFKRSMLGDYDAEVTYSEGRPEPSDDDILDW